MFSANAVKHFPDRRAGIAEMIRVTRPGGLIQTFELNPWTSWKVASRMSKDMPPIFRPLVARKVRPPHGLSG